MATCTIEHHRDGECIARWKVTERMIQREGDTTRIIFPLGQIVLAGYGELHVCLDGVKVPSEVQQ